MSAYGGSFLQDADVGVRLELLEPDGTGEARGPSTHNGDVILHDIALNRIGIHGGAAHGW